MKRLPRYAFFFYILLFPIVAKASFLYCTPPPADPSTSSVYWYIQCLSPYYGVATTTSEFIAGHESGFRWDNVGDTSTSFGVYQIHLPAHPDISKQQALDPVFNVNWSLIEMSEGKEDMWSTYALMK